MSEWISVNDELPSDDSTVIAVVPFYGKTGVRLKSWVGECFFYSGGEGSGQHIFTDSEGNEYEHTEVDAWMPLPDPPTDGAK